MFVNMIVLWVPILTIAVAWVGAKLHSAFIGPLSRYPGPATSKFSVLPYLRAVWTGNEATQLLDWHTSYGSVVRIAPNRLSFVGSQTLWRDIYGGAKGHESRLSKDLNWFGTTLNGASNLLISSDADHRRQRKVFSHAFSDKALKEQEPLLKRWAELLRNKLGENASKSAPVAVDMLKMFNCCTFDIMADLCFAEPLYMLENSEYTPWAKGAFKGVKAATLLRVVRQSSDFMRRLLSFLLPKIPAIRKGEELHFNYTNARLRRRLAASPGRPDLWTYVTAKADGPDGLSLGEQHANAATFMIAGTETSATALSGTIYRLLLSPAAMDKLRHEIRNTFSGFDDMRFESLAQCSYMNAVLKESLRMYPPVPIGLPRVTPRGGASIDGHFVPGGVGVAIHHTATNRSESNWKRPNEFHPERWLGDPDYEADQRDSMEPFSVGPRNCIGQNLAWHEMRLLLATVIWHFDLELCAESRNWADQKVYTLWEKHPLWCKLRPVDST